MKKCFPLLALLFLFVLDSCKREEATTWDSDLLVPIAKGRLTLDNLVADSLLSADESGLWHLRVNRDLADFNLDSIVNVRDTTINLECTLPISGSFNPGFVVPVNFGEEIHLNLPAVQLKHAILKSGTLEYTLVSTVNGDLICNFELPGLKKNGQSEMLQVSTNPGSNSAPFTTTGRIDLADYSLDLTGITGNTFNRIETNFNILVDPQASGPAQVISGNHVVMQLHFIDPLLTYADGYFGEHHYALQEEIKLGNDFNMPTGVLDLDGATMQVNIRNAVGMDAQMQFTDLSGVDAAGSALALSYQPLYMPLNISRAVRSGDGVIANSYGFALDGTNSNLDAFMEHLPSILHIDADVLLNPLGNVTDGNDFIFLDDALEANVNLDVPLRLGMHGLTFVDTLDITTDGIDETFNGNVVLWARSDFPVEAVCDVVLMDDAESRTLVHEAKLNAAANASANGQTIAAESNILLPIDPDVLARFNSDHHLVVRVTLNTPATPEVVGIYSHYGIDIKLIADGDYQIHVGQ
jgi:hypothetical protein